MSTNSKPAIQELPLADLLPDPANVRTHPDKQRGHLTASLRRFGAARSVVIDGKGVVRAGNATLEAAKAAGIEKALIVEADGKSLVVVRRPEWDDTEATAYGIADNRLGELAEWDAPALGDLLNALDAGNFDLDALGYSCEDAAQLMASLDGDRPFAVIGPPPEDLQAEAEHIAEIRSKRRDGNETAADSRDTERYLVVVFKDRQSREAMSRQLGLPEQDRYVPASAISISRRSGAIPRIAADRKLECALNKKSGAAG